MCCFYQLINKEAALTCDMVESHDSGELDLRSRKRGVGEAGVLCLGEQRAIGKNVIAKGTLLHCW